MTTNHTPRIAQCGAMSLGTPDLETSLGFFRDVLGMEVVQRSGDIAYLRAYQELKHHSLVLFASDESIVDSFSFRVERPEDVELFHAQLTAQELEVLELPADQQAGRGTAIRFMLPYSEHPIELYYDISAPRAPEAIRSKLPNNSSTRRGLGLRRVDHFNIQARPADVTRAEKFLRESLGFKRREYVHVPETDTVLASWLSASPQVHDIAISANPHEKNGQMHHLAFNLENHSDLLTAADILRDLDVVYDKGPGKHGVGQAMYLYVRDPGSGHRIELYSGGYLILDPDWEAVEWTPSTIHDGMTWFGDPLDVGNPENPMNETSSASSLTSRLPVSATA